MCCVEVIAYEVSLFSCVDQWGNKVLTEPRSPSRDKRVVLQVFVWHDNGFHVSVLDGDERLPKSAGNLFGADNDHSAAKTSL
jgi:hypothetical protein